MMTLAFGPPRLARGVTRGSFFKFLVDGAEYVCDCGENCYLSGMLPARSVRDRRVQGRVACRCGTRFILVCRLPMGKTLRRAQR